MTKDIEDKDAEKLEEEIRMYKENLANSRQIWKEEFIKRDASIDTLIRVFETVRKINPNIQSEIDFLKIFKEVAHEDKKLREENFNLIELIILIFEYSIKGDEEINILRKKLKEIQDKSVKPINIDPVLENLKKGYV